MRKRFSDYKVYVFDVDGTLYDQPALRKIMAFRLMKHYMLHPFRIRELFALMRFRKVKDKSITSSENDIIKTVSEHTGTDEGTIRSTVKKWIYDDPLSVIKKTRDDRLAALTDELRARGRKVVVFSDYPAKDKLDALGMTADAIYDPDDERIDELKPSPKGLQVIMSDLNALPEDVLMIGDRMEKDGMSAKNCGVDCLILTRRVSERKYDEF